MYYAMDEFRQTQRARPSLFIVLSGSIWASVFIFLYRQWYSLNADPYLYQYWRPLLLNQQSNLWQALSIVLHGYLDPVFSLQSRTPPLLFVCGSVLLLSGWYAVAKLGSVRLASLLAIPLALSFGAGLMNRWYFTARLMMFALPLCAILVAASVAWLGELTRRRALFFFVSVLLIVFPLKFTSFLLRHPVIQDSRSSVDFCLKQVQPTDILYVGARSLPAWLFYSTDWSNPDLERYRWLRHASEMTGPNAGNISTRRSVVNEGNDLRRNCGKGWELVGVAEGGFRNIVDSPDGPADPGWAENESRRIRETNGRRYVILTTGMHDRVVTELITSLRATGARPISSFGWKEARAAILYAGHSADSAQNLDSTKTHLSGQ